MREPIAALARHRKKILLALLVLFVITMQGCFHYRVINKPSVEGTEYKDTVVRSYLWGLVNKPQNFNVTNCDSCVGIDEVVFSKNFGQSFLTVITLGIVSPMKVQWKCHKACPRVIEGL
jgi:hypothetical protein